MSIKSVLDLPVKRQKELAAMMGMTHQEWVEDTKRSDKEMDDFILQIDSGGSELTPEEAKRFQHKIDSGNPPEGADIIVRQIQQTLKQDNQ